MTGTPPVGVLAVNLGTPSAPTPKAVRRYLREFLWDPHVVDVNRVLWWLLLNGVILPRRAPRSAALYQRVWTPEGSPLALISRRQVEGLRRRLGEGHEVVLAMRYGEPSLASGLARLRELGCERLVLLPLFPQYSRTTTGSIEDRVEELLRGGPWRPRIDAIRSFPEHAGYVASLADTIRAAAEDPGFDHLVVSFHGIPRRYAEAGDPYPEECRATAEALVAKLGLAEGDWSLAFQSRFGREEWLRPYADELVVELAAKHRRLAVVCPGFVADCLETIDEIGVELARTFREAGGTELHRVPCVNDSDAFLDALAELVREAGATA